jgi:flavin-dependent dehydrogenase
MRYDIAVIGGGPAGAVFCAELAKAKPNLRILLVDGQSDNQTKVCGGLLSDDAQRLLAEFNLALPKEVLEDPQIFAVETIDLNTNKLTRYGRNYLNMNRYAFDRWLLSRIPKTVDRIFGRCVLAERKDSSYKITVSVNGEKQQYVSSFIVGADGASSIVRKSFFKSKIFRYAAIQQWFKIESDALPYYSCIFDKKTSDSCSWTIRKNEYLIFGGAFRKKGCRSAFEEQKKRLESFLGVKFGEPTKTEACLVCSPRRMKDFIVGRDGAFLIGEAAGFISASSFEGISSAILSGKLLADAFRKAEKDGRKVLKYYKSYARSLKYKMYFKIPKMRVLTSQFLRRIIMKSGITSIKDYRKK